MEITAVRLNQPQRSNHAPAVACAAGAALGAIGRYIVPTKKEISNMLNKEQVDTFVSQAATEARANGRSIAKSAGLGALILGGVTFVASKISDKIGQIKKHSDTEALLKDYPDLGIILDASADAASYALYCYGDEK